MKDKKWAVVHYNENHQIIDVEENLDKDDMDYFHFSNENIDRGTNFWEYMEQSIYEDCGYKSEYERDA